MTHPQLLWYLLSAGTVIFLLWGWTIEKETPDTDQLKFNRYADAMSRMTRYMDAVNIRERMLNQLPPKYAGQTIELFEQCAHRLADSRCPNP